MFICRTVHTYHRVAANQSRKSRALGRLFYVFKGSKQNRRLSSKHRRLSVNGARRSCTVISKRSLIQLIWVDDDNGTASKSGLSNANR